MKVMIHDFGAYAFPIQLSRALAQRGHEVEHVYAAQLETPRGPLEPRPGDPPSLRLTPLCIGEPFAKYDLVRRFGHERRYGNALAGLIRERRPNVVLSANTPLGANDVALSSALQVGCSFVPWVQDLLSVGIASTLRERLHIASYPISKYYARLERRLWAQSALVVLVAESFVRMARRWRVPSHKVRVIENWAPLADLPVAQKQNRWAVEHGVDIAPCLLYSGALGYKHSPSLLVDLSRTLATHDTSAKLIVISEGPGARYLLDQKESLGLANLSVLGYQPFGRLHEVYGAADVLLAILSPEASEFSVPSKVLSYLCAQRPIVAAIPECNPAAEVISCVGSGIVVDPRSSSAFSHAALQLLASPAGRETMGNAGRAYAERAFDIERIASGFEEAILAASARKQS